MTVATKRDTLTVRAGAIVIDTGSEPVISDIPGLSACCHAYTSTGLLDTTHRPRRLVIIGGGHVGLEFASVYAQFGSDVTVLEESGRLLAREDDDVATVEAEAVLVAVGRTPATLGLRLHDAGIRTTGSGAVLDQLTGSGTRSTAGRVAVPSTVFLTPPLARVGITEREAVQTGRSVDVAIKRVEDIAGMPRAEIMGDTNGLIKFVIDADTDQILGAALLCIDSQELINLIVMAMRHHVNATKLRDTIFTHPTSTEAIGEVLSARRPARAKPPMPAVTGVPS